MPTAKIILTGPAADAKAAQAVVDAVAAGLPLAFVNVTSPWSSASQTGRIIITVPCDTQAEADAAMALVAVPEGWKSKLDFEADLAAPRRAEWAAQRAADAAAKIAADVTAVQKIDLALTASKDALLTAAVKTAVKAIITASTGLEAAGTP